MSFFFLLLTERMNIRLHKTFEGLNLASFFSSSIIYGQLFDISVKTLNKPNHTCDFYLMYLAVSYCSLLKGTYTVLYVYFASALFMSWIKGSATIRKVK